MHLTDHLHTMAGAFQEISEGEEPWIALGNFLNDWFDYAKDHRPELVAAPLSLPQDTNQQRRRWAAFRRSKKTREII